MNFTPKRVIEKLVLAVDYATSNVLGPGVTITSAVWSISVVIGTDPNPAAMIDGAAQISGTKVLQSIIGGVQNCTYSPICIATTSTGEVIVLPDPGAGFLQVV